MTLPEDTQSLAEIESFFESNGFGLRVWEGVNPLPGPDEMRQMSRAVRRSRTRYATEGRFWVDLVGTSVDLTAYGSGVTAEAAIRSARGRWRTEQGDKP